jgi:hypothetical protein
MRRAVPDGHLPQDRCLYGTKRQDGGSEGTLTAGDGPAVESSLSAKLKRAGAKPTLFVDQDKGTARDFVESPGCACTDVLRFKRSRSLLLGLLLRLLRHGNLSSGSDHRRIRVVG